MGVDLSAYTYAEFNEAVGEYGWNQYDDPAVNNISEGNFEVFREIVQQRAPHGTPDNVARRCVVALANYTFPIRERGTEALAATPNLAAAWLYSGCGAMVKPYRRKRIRVAGNA